MRVRAIWVVWLSLAVFALWVDAIQAFSQPQKVVAERNPVRLALREIPADLRGQVLQVVQRPTLVSHGPAEVFTGDSALYHWLLAHPDRAVLAWRRLGASCMNITDLGEGSFGCTDGHGSDIRWRTAYESGAFRVWYAEGRIRPAPLLPAVPIRVVFLLRHGQKPDGKGRTQIYHQADLYAQTDSKTAALIIKMLGSSLPRVAEEGLRQIELFFSALVWYCEQHPERTAQLFASDASGETRTPSSGQSTSQNSGRPQDHSQTGVSGLPVQAQSSR